LLGLTVFWQQNDASKIYTLKKETSIVEVFKQSHYIPFDYIPKKKIWN